MKLIALFGHSNCGKSDTLNRLKDLLRMAGKSISSTSHPNSETPETFLYKGLIICVAPAGDCVQIVNKNIQYFNAKKCDVAISASRCKGGTIQTLEQYAINVGASIDWIPKSYEHLLSKSTQEMCNQEMAQLIFDII